MASTGTPIIGVHYYPPTAFGRSTVEEPFVQHPASVSRGRPLPPGSLLGRLGGLDPATAAALAPAQADQTHSNYWAGYTFGYSQGATYRAHFASPGFDTRIQPIALDPSQIHSQAATLSQQCQSQGFVQAFCNGAFKGFTDGATGLANARDPGAGGGVGPLPALGSHLHGPLVSPGPQGYNLGYTQGAQVRAQGVSSSTVSQTKQLLIANLYGQPPGFVNAWSSGFDDGFAGRPNAFHTPH